MTKNDFLRIARTQGLVGDRRECYVNDVIDLLNFAKLVAAQAAEEAQLDADRYRWIRANSRTGLQYSCSPGWKTSHHMLSGRELDEVVDRAIRARGTA